MNIFQRKETTPQVDDGKKSSTSLQVKKSKKVVSIRVPNVEDVSQEPKTIDTPKEQKNEEQAQVSKPVEKQEARKVVCVSKLGADHYARNVNNQDYTFHILNMKVVLDGCSSGKHSEIGVKLFSQLFARKAKELQEKGEAIGENNIKEIVNEIFEKMISFCDDVMFIFQNYCFTILICFELEDEFVVYSCGDGFIIKESSEGIEFEKLDDGMYPAYFVYNFLKPEDLIEYQEGVDFKVTRFIKEAFSNVGVASDGLRFVENLYDMEKNKLMEYLHDGKGPAIEVLINRNNKKYKTFHDDISICF